MKTTIEITKEVYESNKVNNVYKNLYYQNNVYMTLVENRPMIYVKKNDSYYLNVCEREYNDIIMDDEFTEAMVYYFIMDKKEEHITDLLHWFANQEKSFNNAPFSLYDVINCDYDL